MSTARRRPTGVTRLVSANAAGNDAGDGGSRYASFSRDGTKVTFGSNATNLATPLTNGTYNSFVWDVATGTTTLVSVNDSGTGGGDAPSEVGSVSPDGTKVLFSSRAGNLAPPNTGVGGLYERDLQAGVTTRLADGIGGFYSPNGDAVGVLSTASRLMMRCTSVHIMSLMRCTELHLLPVTMRCRTVHL